MHETIVINLEVCSHVILSTVMSYHKCDINVSTQEIEEFAIDFCMKILKTSYSVMEKCNW